MCGICGFWSSGNASEERSREIARAMSDTLVHRGPDDGGSWIDAAAGVALGHRRLSILDLSAAGRQPMVSESGRFALSYNGEIYNFADLRRELCGRGHRFRSRTDTEVLLAAITEWDIEEALRRCNGMFAFALWDREERALTLARDRVGKKPLYYGWSGGSFLFASELKALHAHPDFEAEIDRDSLGLYVAYSWVPSPRSIFRGIRQLPPGTYITLRSPHPDANDQPHAYWSAKEVAEQGERDPFSGSLDEAADELDVVLRQAVKDRMVADVSLGALLSGGFDSTSVVAHMQAESERPINTFSIGFREPRYDEAPYAAAIARHLGTRHTELYVTAQDGREVIPRLPTLYDEPFADESQIPTFLVAQLARSEVTVALSGDGGDELFGGYQSYFNIVKQWRKLARYNPAVRRCLARLMAGAGRAGWSLLAPPADATDPTLGKMQRLAAKLEKRGQQFGASSPVDLYARNRAHCARGHDFVLGASSTSTPLTDPEGWARVDDPLQAIMHLDFATYLADDVLVKVDRASMGVSLEVRCPLLDPRVVAFAWRLPIPLRIGDRRGKLVLRQMLTRYVPPELTDRPKTGFGVPISDWVRGPLREWAEALLDERRLREEGLLEPRSITRMWRQHLSGWRDHQQLLWTILMFQAWNESLTKTRSRADA